MPNRNAQSISKLQELTYEIKIEQAMTQNVVTVSPEMTMAEFREVLRVNSISGTPVLQDGKMVGIISIEDLIKSLAAGELHATVGEKMVQDPVTLAADEPLVLAVSSFNKLQFGRFPVVNGDGQLVGIISQGDIIHTLLQQLQVDYHEEEIHRYRASHIFEDIVADRAALVFSYDVVAKDFDKAGEAASGLKKTLGRLGVHPRIIRRVAVATYEAEINIVVYSDGGEIIAEVRPDRIKVEAIDHGPGIPDIEKAMQPGFSTAPDWVRNLGFGAGMGLPNIKACSDQMQLESTVGVGAHLTIILDCPSRS